jgi:hypothetical protein
MIITLRIFGHAFCMAGNPGSCQRAWAVAARKAHHPSIVRLTTCGPFGYGTAPLTTGAPRPLAIQLFSDSHENQTTDHRYRFAF